MSDLAPDELIALLCIHSFGPGLPDTIVIPLRLKDLGLIACIEDNGMTEEWALTEGGKMLVEALCKTPIPVKKWCMP